MEDQIREPLAGQGKIIQIDEEQVKRRLDNLVRGCRLQKCISCGFFQRKVSVMEPTESRNGDQRSIRRHSCPRSAVG